MGIWVLNASPLIVLGKAGLLTIISPFADQWIIPEGVIAEVARKRAIEPYLDELGGPGQVIRRNVTAIHPVVAAWDLGRGESEVLTTALSMPEAGVVMDDAQARKCAAVVGLTLTGSLGLVLAAKRQGRLAQVKPALEAVRAAGLYIDPGLCARLLAGVGEDNQANKFEFMNTEG